MKTGNTMQRFDIDRWREKLIGQAAVAAIPVMTHPGIEQTGHTVREAVCDGRVHYEAIRALCTRYPAAAATMIMTLRSRPRLSAPGFSFPRTRSPA